MRIYEVGGAVRDEVLGLPVKDRDFVVVGATPEQMTQLGYKPVGRDFPVFLHPETHEEHALARTERKTALGYTGFVVHAAPDVTLEQDLQRRDLTINAIARDESGALIDPFGGIGDLRAGILRHVSPAFAEDPVRVLRVARFAARFGFAIAPETLALMRDMVNAGEADALVAERVWQELARGLMERKPSRMFVALRDCGALARILPEIDRLFGVRPELGAREAGGAGRDAESRVQTPSILGVGGRSRPAASPAESRPQPAKYHPEIDTGLHVMQVVDCAAACDLSLAERFAALTHDLGKGTTPPEILPRHIGHEARGLKLVEELCARLRAPNECRDLARLTAIHHGNVHRALELKPATILRLLEASDAFRKPRRFAEMLRVCECDFLGRIGESDGPNGIPDSADKPCPQVMRLVRALTAAQTVDSGAIAGQNEPISIRERIHEARLSAIRAALGDSR
ncbi:MAG: CCA tRNA nucleotidyltransferase [Pseudomonadota bacterium]|nr:CCA tRNA nucleotidyltransferase [Pseudomonadota bacterium]